jgi:predicted neutral ceramidase superfamily lipid hydrolase
LQRLNEVQSDFDADDLAAERAGAPDKTLTYYRQARAERVKLEDELYAAGRPQSEIAADDLLTARALKIILEHPWRNLALTIPFLWRGATLTFPILLIALLVAVRVRRYDLLLFAAPAFGTVTLYALFTHFIARYDLPALSIATIAIIVSVSFALTLRGANRANPAS